MKSVALITALASTALGAALQQQGTLYADNWSGVTTKLASVNKVTGTFIVPKISGSDKKHSASVWVGIDGNTCGGGTATSGPLIQVGVYLYGDGTAKPFYEWVPDLASITSDIAISAGDKIRMTVDVSTTTSGKGTLENLTTGKSFTHTWSSGPKKLCQAEAEWIVERPGTGDGTPVPFVDYGSVTFTSASASNAAGSSVNPGIAGGTNVVLTSTGNSKGTVMSKCTTSGSDLTCKWQSN